MAPALGNTIPRPISGRVLGPLCLGGAAAIWGGMYVVSAAVLRIIPAFVLLEMRFVIGLTVLGGVAWARKAWRVRRRDLALFALLGMIGYTGSIGLQFVGTALSGAALGSLITAAAPALITLFAVRLLRERLTLWSGLALALGLCGILVVVGLPGAGESGTTGGNLALALAALTWAAYTVGSRIATLRYASLTVTTWAATFGTLFTLPVAIFQQATHPWPPGPSPWLWVGVAYLGVVCTAGGFFLWNKGFEYMPAGSGALYLLLQPVVGSLLGWALLGERLGGSFFAGAALIAAGVATATRRMRPPEGLHDATGHDRMGAAGETADTSR